MKGKSARSSHLAKYILAGVRFTVPSLYKIRIPVVKVRGLISWIPILSRQMKIVFYVNLAVLVGKSAAHGERCIGALVHYDLSESSDQASDAPMIKVSLSLLHLSIK